MFMGKKTVSDVIQNLESLHDARLDFWQRIDLLLTNKDYVRAWNMILDNAFDSDFNEQVEVVANTIVEYTTPAIVVVP
jgi:hypothetical protein